MNRALYECLRQSIIDGSLPGTSRVPPTRDLAAELGVSRNSVLHAYGQLLAEGYLRALTGSGTYVADVLPEQVMFARGASGRAAASRPSPAMPLAARGQALVDNSLASPVQWGAFVPGVPDVMAFPHRKFQQLGARRQRQPLPEWLSYASGGGHAGLREALATHLRQARSVRCDADQIVVTEGVHQAIDLASRLLADPRDTAWLEDPGYWGIRNVLAMNGLRVEGIPVDEEGLVLPTSKRKRAPRLIFVTPSHQYPLGSVMSLRRRLALLEYAREHGSWIVEDDYDSEFRFSGHPIPSLQGMTADAPVVYIGTFSKTLYPGLRIAYMVLPKGLVQAFRTAHSELYREGHMLTQATLADFIADGSYAAHIRRMRLIYASRRAALVALVEKRLGAGWLHPHDSNAGLHIVLSLPRGMDDVRAAREARDRGVMVRPLSRYYAGTTGARGLLLGFACVAESDMLAPFERLLEGLRAAGGKARPAARL
ncbi:MAG: PLP-dependent aminotransferase family protein [Pseudomonadota bacterium]